MTDVHAPPIHAVVGGLDRLAVIPPGVLACDTVCGASPETGEPAILVKLIRVVMLVPLTLTIAFALRSSQAGGGAHIPPLVVAFVVPAILNTAGFFPSHLALLAGHGSRWALLVAVAGVGMNTRLKELRDVGAAAIALVAAETVFLAGIVLAGLTLVA